MRKRLTLLGRRTRRSSRYANRSESPVSVVRINEFRALVGRRDDLRDALNAVLPSIREAAGCIACQLLESQDDPLKFVVLEVWTTRAAHAEGVRDIPGDTLRRTMTLVDDVPRGEYFLEAS